MSQYQRYPIPKSHNKFWVFGDSFAQYKCGKYEADADYSWVYQNHIIKGLGLQHSPEEYNFGEGGSSLDYTYTMLWEQWENFAPGDIVFVAATNWHRAWLLKDLPGLSSMYNIELNEATKWHKYPKGSREAFSFYFKYGHVENNQKAKYQNFLYALSNLQRERNVTVIVLNCFGYNEGKAPNNIIKTKRGSLSAVSQAELIERPTQGSLYIDKRINHLTPVNHKVLAKKILRSIERGIDVDLEKGFYRELYTQDDHSIT